MCMTSALRVFYKSTVAAGRIAISAPHGHLDSWESDRDINEPVTETEDSAKGVDKARARR